MDSGYRKHYGWDAIRNSLAHFALGKTARMVTSLLVFVVVVRVLPPEQYAVYIAFNAAIIALGVITSFGVQKVLFRYLPELRATGNHIAAYRLMLWGMLLRFAVVTLLFAGVLPFIPALSRAFNFVEWAWLFPVYLLMGYLRLTALALSQTLESFLWQKESQYSLAWGGVVTAVSLGALAINESLNLERVVAAEMAGEATSLTLLLVGWLRRWRADVERREGDADWWGKNRGRAVRYGAWGWLLSQSAVLYGSAPNRLFAAHYLPVGEVAILGAADQLVNLARKLIPTRMLMSVVRPVAMARFSAQGDFRAVAALSELVVRLNWGLLALPVTILAVLGPELMTWVTGGKYGDSGYLLMGFLLVLMAEGTRDLVELMVQALEKYSVFFWTSLIQSGSLLIALPLLPYLGVWSLVAANLVGTVLANGLAIHRLRRQGYEFSVHLDLVAWIGVHATVAGTAGWLVWNLSDSLVLTMLVIVATYSLGIALKPPLLDHERDALLGMLSRRRGGQNRAGIQASSEARSAATGAR